MVLYRKIRLTQLWVELSWVVAINLFPLVIELLGVRCIPGLTCTHFYGQSCLLFNLKVINAELFKILAFAVKRNTIFYFITGVDIIQYAPISIVEFNKRNLKNMEGYKK